MAGFVPGASGKLLDVVLVCREAEFPHKSRQLPMRFPFYMISAAVYAAMLGAVTPASAQNIAKALPVDQEPAAKEPPKKPRLDLSGAGRGSEPLVAPETKPELKAGWQTQIQARTFTLSVPAPRGLIVDRRGAARPVPCSSAPGVEFPVSG